MTPGFEPFRKISTRLERYRQRSGRGQDSNGDDSTEQQPDRAQSSATVPRSGPSQSHTPSSPQRLTSIMNFYTGRSASPHSPIQPAQPSDTIASSSTSGWSLLEPWDAFANTNAEAKRQATRPATLADRLNKGKGRADPLVGGLGSQSNPIDLTQNTSDFAGVVSSQKTKTAFGMTPSRQVDYPKVPTYNAPSASTWRPMGYYRVAGGTAPPSFFPADKPVFLPQDEPPVPTRLNTPESMPFADQFPFYGPQLQPRQGRGLDISGDETFAQLLESQWDKEESAGPCLGEPGPSGSNDWKKFQFNAYLLDGLSAYQENGVDSAPPVLNPSLLSQLEWERKVGATSTAVKTESHDWATSSSSSDSEKTAEDIALATAVSEELAALQQFVRAFADRACAGCHKKINLGPKYISAMTRRWATRTGTIVLGSECQNSSCKSSTCIGCGRIIPFFAQNKSWRLVSFSGMQCRVEWCCEKGRLFAIWALACGWETPDSKPRFVQAISKTRRLGRAKAAVSSSPGSPRNKSAHAKGVGYSSELVNFSPFIGYPKRAPAQPAQPVSKKTDPLEELAREAYFKLLALLLPSHEYQDVLNTFPPHLLTLILSRSPLIEQTAMMLSNDSVDEIAGKYHLYDAMLNFVHALGSYPVTAGLVYGDRNIYHSNGGSLLSVSFDNPKGKGKITIKDTGKSLATLLSNLATQSQTVLRHAERNAAEFNNKEGQNLLALSRRIRHISALHTVNVQRFRTEMDISGGQEDSVDFGRWHRENCVKDTPDETIFSNFVFVHDATGAATCAPPRGRMKRLITELSTLQTSLPEGIFVRHGSSRLDVMKVLIIGPKGTPYEHGFFEFDLYCGLDYPNSPPKMRFRTTNGGRTRFNPNLYEDGTICLSLLGTWSGEPWRPKQSTILQMLISIQSMILCEQPWYNEPGRENLENKSQSARYSNEVRSWSLQYALLPWIYATHATNATVSGADANISAQSTAGTADVDAIAASDSRVTPLWRETARLYLLANAKEIVESSTLAASKSKNAVLQVASQSASAGLREKGYLS
ncbi:hypothetical protein F4779DRAFT_621781 [Xylariaceae sp. FL0662B]|nr:hypothetical protein F4779DRAFT_621781 [Xylariaceae sp. FL0662B]